MLDSGTTAQLTKTLSTSIANNEIAGANFMVIKNGKEVFYHEDGLADIEIGRSIARDTIFRLYSMSKPVTATAIMLLLERGELDLFDSVSRYIPGFHQQKVVKEGGLTSPAREYCV
ncbi:serine hydrolase domain-containing protein [Paenibacillus camerounensis]|uniref:serine hydrolase domain-containing protein n=1 Tax=Paenibacillus camerounensis TaxID=1243663 RepID=UPI0005A5EF8D|nr:serine hydrolase domain-containing protein [Paenibacillus camerounensis]